MLPLQRSILNGANALVPPPIWAFGSIIFQSRDTASLASSPGSIDSGNHKRRVPGDEATASLTSMKVKNQIE